MENDRAVLDETLGASGTYDSFTVHGPVDISVHVATSGDTVDLQRPGAGGAWRTVKQYSESTEEVLEASMGAKPYRFVTPSGNTGDVSVRLG